MVSTSSQSERLLQPVIDAIAEVWGRSFDRSLVETIAENYRLSEEFEAAGGPYDPDPIWRDVIECVSNSTTRRVTVLKSTQVGGTVTGYAILTGLAVVDPAPAMLVWPTGDAAIPERDRFYANAEVSLETFSRLVPAPHLRNDRVITLGGMRINMAWPRAKQRLRGKPCKYVWMSETDVYDYAGGAGNPHTAAAERVKRFHDHLIYEESTPVGDDSHIFKQWVKSLQHRRLCPCPTCGKFQELRFFPFRSGEAAGQGGVKGFLDSQGVPLDPEEARASAYYVCVNGCRIDPVYKNSMVAAGRWVAAGQRIDADGNLQGQPIRDDRHVGFHLWTIHQPMLSIGDIAAKYCELYAEGLLRNFFQDWLGLRYSTGKRVPVWRTIADRYLASHRKGQVPADCWFLTGGVDVQEDRLYWLVCGWGPQRTPSLVDWGEVMADVNGDIFVELESDDEGGGDGLFIASDFAKLPRFVLDRVWPVDGFNPLGLADLPMRLGGLDTNYRMHAAHDFVRAEKVRRGWNERTERLRNMRGDDKVKPKEKFTRSVVDKNTRTGKPYEGGLHLWRVYKAGYQEAIAQRLSAAAGGPGVYRWPSNFLPSGRKVARQLCNVRCNDRGLWVPKNRDLGEDFRDCLAIAEACADMVVGQMGWREEVWQGWRRQHEAALQQAENQTVSQPASFLER